jgi:hypothetical protein
MTSLAIRIGLFALPAYGIITTYGTLKPQPDQVTDPEGWARFVSSPSYLIWHVLANVVGTVLIVLGTLALGAFLRASRAPRLGLSGALLAVTGYILFMVPGTLSTFATPAIGAAYLAGNREVMAVEFSPVLGPIVGLALLLALVGRGPGGRSLAIRHAASVGRSAVGPRHGRVLHPRLRPRSGHHRRLPSHPADRRSPAGRQRRLDGLGCAQPAACRQPTDPTLPQRREAGERRTGR